MSQPPAEPMLEVIVMSAAEAREAELGGAHRLELIQRLDLGGVTPEADTVEEVLAATKLPVRVMLRENDGFDLRDDTERSKLRQAARRFAQLPIDGFVVGFLAQRRIDSESLEWLLEHTGGKRCTLHHAFDAAADQDDALRWMSEHTDFDCVLTRGADELQERVRRLTHYTATAPPGVTILCGGGVTLSTLKETRDLTPVRAFHVGRAARTPEAIDGRLNALKIRALRAALENES